MYQQTCFKEERPALLRAAMREIGFAALVSSGLEATHLPLVLDEGDGPLGTLNGHMARANGHWKRAGGAGLAIFLGPHAYVSPSWYPSKRTHGKVVPTWNYIAVHAHGTLTVHDDPAWLSAHLEKLTHAHEAGRAAPWSLADAPGDYLGAMLKGIVGISLAVTRLEGSWKLSQNKDDADYAGVRAALLVENPAMGLRMPPRE